MYIIWKSKCQNLHLQKKPSYTIICLNIHLPLYGTSSSPSSSSAWPAWLPCPDTASTPAATPSAAWPPQSSRWSRTSGGAGTSLARTEQAALEHRTTIQQNNKWQIQQNRRKSKKEYSRQHWKSGTKNNTTRENVQRIGQAALEQKTLTKQ